jgi:Domain of unknown function (DUF4349)
MLSGRLALILLSAVSLFGCQKEPAYGLAGRTLQVAGVAGTAQTTAIQPAQRSDTLAYEHTVSVELDKETLPARLREVESACAADVKSGCTILEVAVRSDDEFPRGSIRMRLAPGGVDSLIELASKGGKIASRNTHAEDLAQPVADTERELALMTTHRDRLAEFMKSRELKVEQLITVSKELATVQAQIESLSTQRANLRRRIDTDLLTIDFSLPTVDYASRQTPVKDSLSLFGSNFREAVGQVIAFVAFLLPWLIVILPGLFLLRLFWRWITRWLVRRELRSGNAG